ncbi:MAG: hypothetical protein JO295_02270 [Verrucomicrobia bacterium]|nr:hypothetical protein [Verrucomicrobiota bacterium]
MQVETIEQASRLVPTMSALLAGFSFSMISNLMFRVEKPRLTMATLICFIAAASAMLVVTFNASCILLSLLYHGYPRQLDYPNLNVAEDIVYLTQWIFYGGLFCLLGGVAMLGWLHSKRVGICACPIIFVAACIILRTMIVLGVNL